MLRASSTARRNVERVAPKRAGDDLAVGVERHVQHVRHATALGDQLHLGAYGRVDPAQQRLCVRGR